MITLKTLIKEVYDLVRKWDGVTYDGDPFFGGVILKFKNGQPTDGDFYEVNKTGKLKTDEIKPNVKRHN